ncbi:hypothetical protein M501DRAFT_1040307 [Patellaria atrata CBS 101060]|uniref:Uncharacterized protein n=1 Tax=Patellaria atrata CBS 101060 TaxID=1346257 RepID=A0A9P4S675_9PEZI|nr:hypothetical protein M501DRAFT_1040307 [Patellaria atrata CBS 101060]
MEPLFEQSFGEPVVETGTPPAFSLSSFSTSYSEHSSTSFDRSSDSSFVSRGSGPSLVSRGARLSRFTSRASASTSSEVARSSLVSGSSSPSLVSCGSGPSLVSRISRPSRFTSRGTGSGPAGIVDPGSSFSADLFVASSKPTLAPYCDGASGVVGSGSSFSDSSFCPSIKPSVAPSRPVSAVASVIAQPVALSAVKYAINTLCGVSPSAPTVPGPSQPTLAPYCDGPSGIDDPSSSFSADLFVIPNHPSLAPYCDDPSGIVDPGSSFSASSFCAPVKPPAAPSRPVSTVASSIAQPVTLSAVKSALGTLSGVHLEPVTAPSTPLTVKPAFCSLNVQRPVTVRFVMHKSMGGYRLIV